MARMLKNREISCISLLNMHIQQIEMVNPLVNSMVCNRFNQARREAIQCDELLDKTLNPDSLPVYFGVPITIKEAMQVVGMPNTTGIISRQKVKISENSDVVDRMISAGCIILGVTNTSEGCMWMESSNGLYGTTNNPYSLNRTPGGSSGGEASGIASCFAPFGLGSDVGGSIRMPAFFCGLFGHKPSSCIISNAGQYPIAMNEMDRYVTTGPICRNAEDLWPMLEILCIKRPEWTPDDVDVGKIKIYSMDSIDRIGFRTTRELRDVQKSVCNFFESNGNVVECVNINELNSAAEIWSAMMSAADSPSFYETLEKPFVTWELIKWIFNLSYHTLPALLLCYLESLTKVLDSFSSQNKKMVQQGYQLEKKLTKMLGKNAVLIFPSHALQAPRHHQPISVPFRFAYTAIFNVLEFAVTQVPLGLSKNGLPLGLQIVAPHGQDHVTVALAIALEKKFGGWKPPKG